MDEEEFEILVTPKENVRGLITAMVSSFINTEKIDRKTYRNLIKDFKLIFKHTNEFSKEHQGYITSENNLDLCANAFFNHYNEMNYFYMSRDEIYDLCIEKNGTLIFKPTEEGKKFMNNKEKE